MVGSITVSVRMRYTMYDELMHIADTKGLSQSDIIRDAVKEYIENYYIDRTTRNGDAGNSLISRIFRR